ncbi:MAG: AAA family ATPase [Candidatus Methanospirareceae archaeon]
MKIIAFVGAPAAGKTEAAAVAKKMGIPVITMGDVIREELRKRGLPLNDENAGRVADELRRKEGMDAIARRCIPKIREVEKKMEKVVVIEGIRGIEEVKTFKKAFGSDFTLIRIEAPLHLRYKRAKLRRRGDDFLTFEQFKEREEREKRWGMAEAMEEAEKVIKNEGSLDEFKRKIEELLRVLAPS